MKISYAILTKNEGTYVEQLLSFLVEHKQPQDEIIVVDDYSTDHLTTAILNEHEAMNNINLYRRELNNDFASQKNYLTSLCTGDYIFQIDADERPSDYIMSYIHEILENNLNVEVFLVPRINTVEGLTHDHIQKWGWQINEHGWVNFPDFQWRIYKNIPTIKWVNKVHEKLAGFGEFSSLPTELEYCLTHYKTITRQEAQNEYYNTL